MYLCGTAQPEGGVVLVDKMGEVGCDEKGGRTDCGEREGERGFRSIAFTISLVALLRGYCPDGCGCGERNR